MIIFLCVEYFHSVNLFHFKSTMKMTMRSIFVSDVTAVWRTAAFVSRAAVVVAKAKGFTCFGSTIRKICNTRSTPRRKESLKAKGNQSTKQVNRFVYKSLILNFVKRIKTNQYLSDRTVCNLWWALGVSLVLPFDEEKCGRYLIRLNAVDKSVEKQQFSSVCQYQLSALIMKR